MARSVAKAKGAEAPSLSLFATCGECQQFSRGKCQLGFLDCQDENTFAELCECFQRPGEEPQWATEAA